MRNLEREIASICRKVAKEVVKTAPDYQVKVSGPDKVKKYLGVPEFRYGKPEEEERVGIATGMAWTEVGGELSQIEVTSCPARESSPSPESSARSCRSAPRRP